MKFVPWVLSGVLAVILVVVFVMKNNQIDQLQQQFDQLTVQHNSFVAEAKQKEEQILSEARNALSEAGQRQQMIISEASKVIASASQPEVQVSVVTRQAMFGSGLVAMIKNNSGEMAAVSIEAKRPASGQSRTYELVMNSGMLKEIGHAEGWAFVSGDTVTVSQPNHKSKVFNIQ